jgi:hypothetical protein
MSNKLLEDIRETINRARSALHEHAALFGDDEFGDTDEELAGVLLLLDEVARRAPVLMPKEWRQDRARRHATIAAACSLIFNLSDDTSTSDDHLERLIDVGAEYDLNGSLLLMACHARHFENGKRALSLLDGMISGQPPEVLLALHAELGQVLREHAQAPM